jgi:hypothetical protein
LARKKSLPEQRIIVGHGDLIAGLDYELVPEKP